MGSSTLGSRQVGRYVAASVCCCCVAYMHICIVRERGYTGVLRRASMTAVYSL